MNFNKKLAAAVSGAVLLMAGQFALADSTTDIVDALVGKGVLTEEEGKLITKGHTSKVEKTPKITEKDGAFSISSPNGKNSVQLTGRMHFDYRNSNINQFDNGLGTYAFSNDSDSKSVGDHFAMRRARIGIKGRIGGMADYLLLANVQGSDILDEGYLDINKFEPLGLKFGKFKQPMNLEIMTSSNNIDFIERSYLSQNTPEKKFGVGLHGEIKGITYFGSMFNNNDAAQSQKDDSMSYAGRGTVNFAELMDNKDLVAHFGVNGYTSQYEITPTTSSNTSGDAEATTRGTVFSYTSGGAGLANMLRAQIGGERMLGTSGVCASGLCEGYNLASPSTSTVKTRKGGLEGIVAYKNFKVQGEYANQNWKASTANLASEKLDADVNTWYVEALWTLTGEKYADQYKKGAFGLAKPSNEVNLDSLNLWSNPGLWEASIRVDGVDLSGGTVDSASDYSRVQGSVVKGTDIDSCKGNATNGCKGALSGGAKSTTLGIKWVLTPNLLFKANYTYTDFDNSFAPIDIGTKTSVRTTANTKLIDHEDLFMLRGQYMF